MKLLQQPTLADSICDIRTRKIKMVFFEQINTLLDWQSISTLIDKHYKKGKSAVGKPSYGWVLLFKMCFLQTWCGLEDCVNNSVFFSCFCELNINQIL